MFHIILLRCGANHHRLTAFSRTYEDFDIIKHFRKDFFCVKFRELRVAEKPSGLIILIHSSIICIRYYCVADQRIPLGLESPRNPTERAVVRIYRYSTARRHTEHQARRRETDGLRYPDDGDFHGPHAGGRQVFGQSRLRHPSGRRSVSGAQTNYLIILQGSKIARYLFFFLLKYLISMTKKKKKEEKSVFQLLERILLNEW